MKVILFFFFSFSLLFSESKFEEIKVPYFKSYDYEHMEKYTEALKVLSPIYKKYPKGYTINLRFAWLSYLRKKYADAQKYYEQASLSNLYALAPRLGLILISLDRKEYKEAEISAYKLLKIDYYNYYANFYIVKALTAQEKYEISSQIIHKMLALYPTDIRYLEELVKVYQKTNKKYLEKLYQNILILDPNNIVVRNSMG